MGGGAGNSGDDQMDNTYDVIVLGLGGMGSAAAYHLAGRGSGSAFQLFACASPG